MSTKVLLQLDEEVIRKFVDIDGTPSNQINHTVDVTVTVQPEFASWCQAEEYFVT